MQTEFTVDGPEFGRLDQLVVPASRGQRGQPPLDDLVGAAAGATVGQEAASDPGVDGLAAQLPLMVAAGQGPVEDHVGDERAGAGQVVEPVEREHRRPGRHQGVDRLPQQPFEVLLAILIVYAPPLRTVFQTAPPPVESLLLLLPFPFVVWGADELYRWRRRLHHDAQRT